MADNYLERARDDWERRKQARREAERRAWQKRLKAYQEQLKRRTDNDTDKPVK